MSAEELEAARRHRGISRGSITRLLGKVTELQKRPPGTDTLLAVQRLTKNINAKSEEFKERHLKVVELIPRDSDFSVEQAVLDEHDEIVEGLLERLDGLTTLPTTAAAAPEENPREMTTKRLTRIRKRLSSVVNEVDKFDTKTVDHCLIRLREEQLLEVKQELNDVGKSSFAISLEDKDELSIIQAEIEASIFDTSLKIKRLLSKSNSSTAPTTDTHGVKLPKIDVPTFTGDILNWNTYWEQFSVAIHDRTDISDIEKLVYLRHSVKDGSARPVIDGLSRTGDQYQEAVECLRSRYDRPRIIHQTHVRKIIDIPTLKHGSGKELRHLHDTAQQHVRALKSMGYEPSGAFLTSILELKLDPDTMFEWQRHSNSSSAVPHYSDLLEFINLRARATEHSVNDSRRMQNEMKKPHKHIVSNPVNTTPTNNEVCPLCKSENHLLFACLKFKGLSPAKRMSMVKSSGLCLNCLRSGHFSRNCKSLHKCRECQRPHHTLLHVESTTPSPVVNPSPVHDVISNTAAAVKSTSLLMTCQVVVYSPSGFSMKARALLDPGSSASFISDRLSRSIRLSRRTTLAQISGIAGISPAGSAHPLVDFSISPPSHPKTKLSVSAIVIPIVTRDLPTSSVPFCSAWKHLKGLQLADPSFGSPGPIDLLLGVDIFSNTLMDGRRSGPPGSPIALQTKLGWVLAGDASTTPSLDITCNHISLRTGDELLYQFWQIEEPPSHDRVVFSAEENAVVDHFLEHHTRSPEGRFIVPLPKRLNVPELGESRSQAVRRFLNMERSLRAKGRFDQFAEVVEEYFDLYHAEPVPIADLHKPSQQVFYMPMHAVHKESSTTTKLRVVFDASAKSSSGSSLNDILMVGPTIHSSLIDALLRFRLHQIALIGDVSKMYRAVELSITDRDYHRFVWRSNPNEPLQDYRMTRVTFGVSASSFVANMAVRQNSIDHANRYPLAAKVVEENFYVDDCLTGAETPEETILLRNELQELFNKAHFILRKWNSSSPAVLESIDSGLRELPQSQTMPNSPLHKTLGIEWDSHRDVFHLTTTNPSIANPVTKRELASDIAKTYDVLGWFSPSIIKSKILLQRLWERKIDWDDEVPQDLLSTWYRWKAELPLLSSVEIRRCYFPTTYTECSLQLHGFSDASEEAYGAVVYLRSEDREGKIHVSLVTSKTRVAPVKKQTIPRLELCGAVLLSQLITHVKTVLSLPNCELFAWTDSMVACAWMDSGRPSKIQALRW